MAHLAISLLGSFWVTLDGQPLTAFSTDKVRALLAFLAVESGRSHRREALSVFLWPDRPEARARNNLRQGLYQLRRSLATCNPSSPHLLVTAKEVQFDLASDHWLDVAEFETHLHLCLAHHPLGSMLCTDCIKRLDRAAQLYQGDFLAGFSLPGCPAFEEWRLVTQEAYHRQCLQDLVRLASFYEARRDYARASHYARRETELEPWREAAHRRYMRALALDGRRGEALRHYAICRRELAEEMGIEPSTDTTLLYECIRDGTLQGLARTQEEDEAPPPSAPRVASGFVGREPELAALNCRLKAALAGRGGVALIAGEVGSGKSVLLREFTRRALQVQRRLLVVGDSCDARVGAGHPYQPFVGILAALVGGSERLAVADDLAALQTRRLGEAFPAIARSLVEAGPDLIGTLVPAQIMRRRAGMLGKNIGREVGRLLAHSPVQSIPIAAPDPGRPQIEQAVLFDQVTQVLLALARQRPLILTFDDLQWADAGSIHLLFHLARRVRGSPLLIVAAYRPEDIAPGRDGVRHPLESVLNEFKARYGDVTVDLSRADGRRFIGALLEERPSHLGPDLQEVLYRHTEGHALFAVEMLRAMEARGELIRDAVGQWVAKTQPHRNGLPARIEAVIGERVAHLPELCREALAAASVQGETFVIEVLARALNCRPSQALERVNVALGGPHDLVCALGFEFTTISQDGSAMPHTLCRYRFRHYLYQQYLYCLLNPVARCRLHQATGEALEALYRSPAGLGDGREGSAPHLAWHFERSGQTDKAVAYLLQAGQDAFCLSAHVEAIFYLERGLALLNELPDTLDRARQELSYLLALNGAVSASKGIQDPARMPALRRMAALCEDLRLTSCQIQVLFMQWSFSMGRGEYDRCLDLACRAQALVEGEEEEWLCGLSALALGMTYALRGSLSGAAHWFERPALGSISERSGDLDYLIGSDLPMLWALLHAMVTWVRGYPDQAWEVVQTCTYHEEERGHRANLGVAHFALGYVRLLRRERAHSSKHIHKLVELAESSGFPAFRFYAGLLGGWGRLQGGASAEAAGILGQHVQFCRSLGSYKTLSFACGLQAQAHAENGSHERAMEALDESLVLVAQTGEQLWEAELYRIQGEIWELYGDMSRAVSSYQTALAIARRQGARSWELRAANSMCRLWAQQGRRAEARDLLAGIYGWFSEGFDTPDLQKARALLDQPEIAVPMILPDRVL